MNKLKLITRFESAESNLKAGMLDPIGAGILEAAVLEVKDKLEKNPPLELYGKVVHQRRHVGFFANPDQTAGYFYSKTLARSKLPGPAMKSLMTHINDLFEANFNGILVNFYLDGNDYISDHSDSEAGLDKQAGVVIVSYGATRIMQFKKRKDAPEGCCAFKKGKYEIPLVNNSIVVMAGKNFQTSYTHGIPKQKSVEQGRFSFTFRVHDGKGEGPKLEKAEKTIARINKKLKSAGPSTEAPSVGTPAAKRMKVE